MRGFRTIQAFARYTATVLTCAVASLCGAKIRELGKSPITLAIILSFLSSSGFAQIIYVTGPVTALYTSPGQIFDTRNCTFFQVNNSQPWYAIPFSDPGYEGELIILRDSFEFSRNITFATDPAIPTCGLASAFDLFVGTAH
jgi:hypothetical protein